MSDYKKNTRYYEQLLDNSVRIPIYVHCYLDDRAFYNNINEEELIVFVTTFSFAQKAVFFFFSRFNYCF